MDHNISPAISWKIPGRSGLAFLLAGFVFMAILLATSPARAQQVTHLVSPQSLDDRVAEARSNIGSSDGWIVFSFERLMCERCFTGSLRWDSDWKASIADIIHDREPSGRSVQQTVRDVLNDMDGDDAATEQLVQKDVAVLLQIQGGAISRVHHVNMDLSFKFDDLPVLWVGKHSPESILGLFDHRTWQRFGHEARKGWVWTLGALQMSQASLAWLTTAYETERETDVRKAIAFAIGNTDSEDSVEVLKDIIDADPDRDVKKAAIHALGNGKTIAARDALMEIIWKWGTRSRS